MESQISQNSRLVLGTAQFGMPYGVANKIGQPDFLSVESIVAEVWKWGVREFDTAQAYGDSEGVLGKVLHSLGIAREAKVISKLNPAVDHQDANALGLALQQTLGRLGVPKLYGLLLHSEDLLDSLLETGLMDTLNKFIAEDLVERIGVSVYTPQKALQALNTEGIKLLQVPSNLLDRRFEELGVFNEARRLRKQIYVRSIFLQGILLIKVSDLPKSMKFALPVIEKLVNFSKKTGFPPKQLALGYVKSVYQGQKVIFGCETVQQASENLKLWAAQLPEEIVMQLREEFQNIPEKILNPSLWD